ncbi:hypothetical protein MNBD_NITROSPINAE03-1810 [hydrothermal vent metagenome]|uniref:SnoaL-like domain-containing protein n=1 Tax=hydrothermal vent metagenome TaxID=652676 RepID=A0A3B1BV46_9ZZZZ
MIQEMNRRWTVENNADELKNYFHKDMVAITPTDSKRIEGGENCVVGWKNFTENGLHHEIYLSDPRKTAPEKMKTVLRQPVK